MPCQFHCHILDSQSFNASFACALNTQVICVSIIFFYVFVIQLRYQIEFNRSFFSFSTGKQIDLNHSIEICLINHNHFQVSLLLPLAEDMFEANRSNFCDECTNLIIDKYSISICTPDDFQTNICMVTLSSVQ